jgi:hypothetical protein
MDLPTRRQHAAYPRSARRAQAFHILAQRSPAQQKATRHPRQRCDGQPAARIPARGRCCNRWRRAPGPYHRICRASGTLPCASRNIGVGWLSLITGSADDLHSQLSQPARRAAHGLLTCHRHRQPDANDPSKRRIAASLVRRATSFAGPQNPFQTGSAVKRPTEMSFLWCPPTGEAGEYLTPT